MFKKGLSFALIIYLIILQKSYAQDIADPMRPPSVSGNAPLVNKPKTVTWSVSAILVSTARKLAFVNSKLVGVGEEVDGAKVIEINKSYILLNVRGEILKIKPLNQNLKRSARQAYLK